MLRDKDRREQYERAIRAEIARYVDLVGEKPHVVDLGAGTGLLSMMALEHGARCATLVDVNMNMLDMARTALEEKGYEEGVDFNIFHGSFTRMAFDAQIWSGTGLFDMLVCEIIGTLTTSESMQTYIPDALKHVRAFEGKHFVVPSSATQKLSLCRIPLFDKANPCVNYAHDNLLPDWGEDNVVRFVSTNGSGLNLYNLHEYRFFVYESHAIRVDTFDQVGCDLTEQVEFYVPRSLPQNESRNHFLVLEWKCTLAHGIELSNTLQGYKRIEHPSSVDRAVAWGFMLAQCVPLQKMCEQRVRFDVSYPNDWPRIELEEKCPPGKKMRSVVA